MKAILAILLILIPFPLTAQDPDFLAMFINLENFFDYRDSGGGESDTEFSSGGERHWTRKRFRLKCSSFAKTVLWTASEQGRLPDVIAVAEIENAFVLKSILSSTLLRKTDYRYVHYDSPDPRGIDCALFYRSSRVKLLSSRACRVEAEGLRTRDILLAQLLSAEGDSIALMVNHLPSKYGGAEDWRREVAAGRLRFISDSLAREGWGNRLALGDFNDGPDSPLFAVLEPSLIYCHKSGKQRGSIRFNGQWELIDLCFVSPELAPRSDFEVLVPPFLMTADAAHSGEKPLRTYSGPRWIGGLSDHLPIIVRVNKDEKPVSHNNPDFLLDLQDIREYTSAITNTK